MIFILDQCHALDCADAAVKAVTPRESKQKDWMKTIKERPDAERVDDVIADPKPHLRLEAVATCIRTCRTNGDRMRYDLCRTNQLPTVNSITIPFDRRLADRRIWRSF